LPTATRTVVFTDLANFTARVSRADREGLRDLLQTHESNVLPVLQRHRGRVVKNLGDSFMALFDSATDAVRASIDLLEAVHSVTLPLRVSVATGDVEETEADAFGHAVNLASRINGCTPAGEVWFSASTLACMNQSEIPWEQVGYFALKGIAGEHPLYRGVPMNRAWLPEGVRKAAKLGNLVIAERGEMLPGLPNDAVLLLRGYRAGTDALQNQLEQLPPMEPENIWLMAYNISPVDRYEWTDKGYGLVIGHPEPVDSAIEDCQALTTRSTGSDTLVFEIGAAISPFGYVDLVGLALPAVPMGDVVAGYSYELLEDGQWVNQSEESGIQIDVDTSEIYMLIKAADVSFNDTPAQVGRRHTLSDRDTFKFGGNEYTFRKLDGAYTAWIESTPITRIPLVEGERLELGREPNRPGLSLPDRRGSDNIRWCDGVPAKKARDQHFTLDRALAGRRQASVTPTRENLTLEVLHKRCPTWLYRNGTPLRRLIGNIEVMSGDVLFLGTSAVRIADPLG